MNKLERWLALRWAMSRVKDARKDAGVMGKTLQLLDGNKRLIVTLGFVASTLVALVSGQDVSQWLDLALRAFGWTDAGVILGAKELATQIAPLLFALWAAGHGLWKLWRQHSAGATAVELGSTAGVVKAAVASGDLVVVNNTITDPAVLELKGSPVVAKADGLPVTA